MNEFINKLFYELNKENIQYAILRNYENLPEKDSTSEYFDLDLIVLAKQYKHFFSILETTSLKCKLDIAKKINREYVKTTQIYKIENDNFINAIQIDVHIKGQNWWGNYYLHEKEILEKRFLNKNFYVVSKFHENLIKWLDKLFWGNYIKKKYEDEIIHELNKNHVELAVFLQNVFGKELSILLFNLIKNGHLRKTLKLRNQMIIKLINYSFIKYPLLTIKSIIYFFYTEFILRLSPLGICLVFNNKDEDICCEIFNKFKLLLITKQIIIKYDGKNIYEWLFFYFSKVFPTVRKSGLVCIITNNNYSILKSKVITISSVDLNLFREIILSYKNFYKPFFADLIIKK